MSNSKSGGNGLNMSSTMLKAMGINIGGDIVIAGKNGSVDASEKEWKQWKQNRSHREKQLWSNFIKRERRDV